MVLDHELSRNSLMTIWLLAGPGTQVLHDPAGKWWAQEVTHSVLHNTAACMMLTVNITDDEMDESVCNCYQRMICT